MSLVSIILKSTDPNCYAEADRIAQGETIRCNPITAAKLVKERKAIYVSTIEEPVKSEEPIELDEPVVEKLGSKKYKKSYM